MTITRFDLETPLPSSDFLPPEYITEGDPRESGKVYFESEDGRLHGGIWVCSSHTIQVDNFPYDEIVIVLEGSSELTDETGTTQVFNPGQCFSIAKGSKFTWKIIGPYKEYFLFAM